MLLYSYVGSSLNGTWPNTYTHLAAEQTAYLFGTALTSPRKKSESKYDAPPNPPAPTNGKREWLSGTRRSVQLLFGESDDLS
jgi:hypothetical protein